MWLHEELDGWPNLAQFCRIMLFPSVWGLHPLVYFFLSQSYCLSFPYNTNWSQRNSNLLHDSLLISKFPVFSHTYTHTHTHTHTHTKHQSCLEKGSWEYTTSAIWYKYFKTFVFLLPGKEIMRHICFLPLLLFHRKKCLGKAELEKMHLDQCSSRRPPRQTTFPKVPCIPADQCSVCWSVWLCNNGTMTALQRGTIWGPELVSVSSFLEQTQG
jgi:hypothetical protein